MNNTKSRSLPLSRRGMSFETFMWLFTRLSALAMYALVIVGLIGALIMGAQNQMNFVEVVRWVISPNAHHVHGTSVADITPWVTRFWKIIAAGLLLIGAAHGVHGVIVIADDYITSARGRLLVRILNMGAFLLVSLVGLYVLWKS